MARATRIYFRRSEELVCFSRTEDFSDRVLQRLCQPENNGTHENGLRDSSSVRMGPYFAIAGAATSARSLHIEDHPLAWVFNHTDRNEGVTCFGGRRSEEHTS